MELKRVLERIPDPRGRQGQDYRLWSILGLILVSMLCGGGHEGCVSSGT
jgi:hypothetical protein